MESFKVKAVAFIVGLSALAGCQGVGTNYQSLQTDTPIFMSLQENVRFAGESYPRGATFEAVQLPDGRLVVGMQRVENDFLILPLGGGLTQRSTRGVVLDQDLCTFGQAALFSGGGALGGRVGIFEAPGDNPHSMFGSQSRFCFSIL